MLNFNIKDFLARIQGAQAADFLMRQTIQEVVKKSVGLDLSADSIVVKNSTLTVKGISSAARSALFVKKQAIIDQINQEINKGSNPRKIVEIR